ncbi:MAG: bifunctional phosphoglucose/phosphomannose isomerase [Candidatus Pacebacteria bacterium]|nr:bifunctional phosphoglucose/phosphomannose isomerase [Candidatus Paceibacterota bacterium]
MSMLKTHTAGSFYMIKYFHMEEAIKSFNEQFLFDPVIVNGEKLTNHKNIVLAGMGGSHLAAGIIKSYKPGIDIYVHRAYDLPPYDDEFLKDSLLIASSYSGNTEEVISFLDEGLAKGYQMAVISTGGALIEKAKEFNLPHIEIPDTGIQPRSALGYSTIALAKFIKDDEILRELKNIKLDPEEFRSSGEELARGLENKIPIIYSSTDNLGIAYNWKIKMNETGKIPAFYNIFPEMNHNEIVGFDNVELSKNFKFIILKDRDDHKMVQKRMEVFEKIFEEKGLEVIKLELEGENTFEKIFKSLLLADWTALSVAKIYGSDPEKVPTIEKFKSLIK